MTNVESSSLSSKGPWRRRGLVAITTAGALGLTGSLVAYAASRYDSARGGVAIDNTEPLQLSYEDALSSGVVGQTFDFSDRNKKCTPGTYALKNGALWVKMPGSLQSEVVAEDHENGRTFITESSATPNESGWSDAAEGETSIPVSDTTVINLVYRDEEVTAVLDCNASFR